MSIRSKLEPNDDVKMTPVSITDVLPRAKALGTARAVRLREQAQQGGIQRD